MSWKAWGEYVSRMEVQHSLPAPLVESVLRFSRAIGGYVGGPPARAGCVESKFELIWDKGPHVLEVEVASHGGWSWLYRNRETERVVEGEYFGRFFAPEQLRRLNQLLREVRW